MTTPDKKSFVDFNGYKKGNIKEEDTEKIVWLKPTHSFYWASMVE